MPQFPLRLLTAPSNFNLAMMIIGGGLVSLAGIAADASGNVWATSASGNSITELSSTGELLTRAAGYIDSDDILGA